MKKQNTNEQFKTIEYDGLTLNVGNLGTIKLGEDVLKLYKNKFTGYMNVMIGGKLQYSYPYVHRLVAMAWIPNPENKEQVDHINNKRTDNRASNLRWVSREENNSRKHSSKLKSKNCSKPRERIGGYYQITNGNDTHVFKKQSELAAFLGVSRQNIIYCMNNGWKVCRKWTIKYVKEQ